MRRDRSGLTVISARCASSNHDVQRCSAIRTETNGLCDVVYGANGDAQCEVVASNLAQWAGQLPTYQPAIDWNQLCTVHLGDGVFEVADVHPDCCLHIPELPCLKSCMIRIACQEEVRNGYVRY